MISGSSTSTSWKPTTASSSSPPSARRCRSTRPRWARPCSPRCRTRSARGSTRGWTSSRGPTGRSVTWPRSGRRSGATQLRGYSTDDRENEPFGACVGAAIVGADGRPVGALSISGPYFRIHDRLQYFGERVRAVAGAIARELGADASEPTGGRPRHAARRPDAPPGGRVEARRRVRADLHAVCRERGRRPRRPALQPRALRGERDPRLPGAGVQRREPEPGGRREAPRPRRCRAPQGARAGGPGRCRVRRAARGGALPRGRGGPRGRLRARPVAGLLPGADDGRGPVPVLLARWPTRRGSRSSSTTPRASAASP